MGTDSTKSISNLSNSKWHSKTTFKPSLLTTDQECAKLALLVMTHPEQFSLPLSEDPATLVLWSVWDKLSPSETKDSDALKLSSNPHSWEWKPQEFTRPPTTPS